MVKAAAGGGGRGLRLARDAAELAEAFERCASEALAAFGDDALYVEEFFADARHIEVQVAGDGKSRLSRSASANARCNDAGKSWSRSRRVRR